VAAAIRAPEEMIAILELIGSVVVAIPTDYTRYRLTNRCDMRIAGEIVNSRSAAADLKQSRSWANRLGQFAAVALVVLMRV